MIAALLWLYKLSLRAYPKEFRANFADELVEVFSELLAQRARQGRWVLFVTGFMELYHLPAVLCRLHWRAWCQRGARRPFIRAVYRSPFHPVPAAQDGRFSWGQTLLEVSTFLVIGGGLVTLSYVQPAWIPTEWSHRWFDASGWVALAALSIFGVGLLRDLPRWSYPAGGLLVGHTLFTAQVSGLVIFWISVLLISFSLLLAAVYIHLHSQPLAPFLARLGRSLALDWTRTAFGFYSMIPYVIVSAFDDTYPNNRTAYFALALLVMNLGAVAYCRSQRQEQQFGVLVGGVTGALVVALLEQIYLQGRWLANLVWLSSLWAGMLTLFLLPMLASLLYRTWVEDRSTQTGS